jgi:hypothetical protein
MILKKVLETKTGEVIRETLEFEIQNKRAELGEGGFPLSGAGASAGLAGTR